MHMGDSGVESVLALKTQNAAKTRSCLEMDVLCVEVLTVAACRTRMLALHSGLFEVLVNMREDISFLHAQLDANERANRTINVIVRLRVGGDIAEILRELQVIENRDAMLHTLWNSVLVGETRRPCMRLADITNRSVS